MKKILVIFSALTISFVACNNAENGSNENKKPDETSASFDTTQHPNAVTNDAVISTDTAAMNTQKAEEKLDSANKKKNKK